MQDPTDVDENLINSSKDEEVVVTNIFKSDLDAKKSIDDFSLPIGPVFLRDIPRWCRFERISVKVLVRSSSDYKIRYEINVRFKIIKIFGYSSGFAMLVPLWGCDNISGRTDLRSEAFRAAARAVLLAKHAHTVWGRYISTGCLPSSKCSTQSGIVYVSSGEPERLRVKLPSSIDQFIEGLTKKSRRSLRYYSKKLEDELGCRFISDMNEGQISAAIRALCSGGRYQISETSALKRHTLLRQVDGSFVSGLQDKQGRWISAIGGWRKGPYCFIVWQLNLDLAEQSVSNTMRLKFLKAEIQNKTEYLAFVGGTSGLWCRACQVDHSESFLAFDSGLRATITRTLAYFMRPSSRITDLYKRAAMSSKTKYFLPHNPEMCTSCPPSCPDRSRLPQKRGC